MGSKPNLSRSLRHTFVTLPSPRLPSLAAFFVIYNIFNFSKGLMIDISIYKLVFLSLDPVLETSSLRY